MFNLFKHKQQDVPKLVQYTDDMMFNEIAIAKDFVWNFDANPTIFITGGVGSGKTTCQELIMYQCAELGFRVHCIDVQKANLTPFNKLHIYTEIEDVKMFIDRCISTQFDEPQLIVVDEIAHLFSNEYETNILSGLLYLIRHGDEHNVYMCLGSNYPEFPASDLNSEFGRCIDVLVEEGRTLIISLGGLSPTKSNRLFSSKKYQRDNGVGVGYIRLDGVVYPIQIYYISNNLLQKYAESPLS